MINDEIMQELITLLRENNMKREANDTFEICNYIDGLQDKILYRPPKVRPKNLTIGRSVFLWLNIASNLRKKLLWHI